MGCAVAVFAFLPWCQVRRGHAAVDILTARLPPRGQAVFGLIGDAVMSVVAGVILWRLWLAFGERFPHGPDPWRAALGFGARPVFVETSAELGVPVWIPYLGALAGAALFALVCLHGLWRALNALLDGPDAGPAAAGGAA
jgi:TRAP-type C4-dicarboxylate transport system permease small subunit